MGTGSKSQPSVYDLSDKSLAAQKKFLDEMHMVEVQSLLEPGKDEKSMLFNKKHLQDILTTLHNHLHKDLKPILEKHRVTEEDLKVLNDEKFFKDFKLNTMLKGLRTRMMTEEAVALFTHHEQLRDKLIQLKALLHKLADAEYAWQVVEAETERMKFEEDMQQFLQLADYDKQKSDSLSQMKDCKDAIIQIDEHLANLKVKKQQTLRNFAEEHYTDITNFKTADGKSPFANISKEDAIKIREDVVNSSYNRQKEINQLHSELNDIKKSEAQKQTGGSFISTFNLDVLVNKIPRVQEIHQRLKSLNQEEGRIQDYRDAFTKNGHGDKFATLSEQDKKALKKDLDIIAKPTVDHLLIIKKDKTVHIEKRKVKVEEINVHADSFKKADEKENSLNIQSKDSHKESKNNKKDEKKPKDDVFDFLDQLESEDKAKNEKKSMKSK